jgi:L-alanine-DL-glutamate epimerase-like enolase superfamily enzyme
MRDFSNHASNRGPGRDVAITNIETCVVRGNFEWNLVRVHTDAGVTGVGESCRGGAVTGIMEYMKRFLVGENPLDVERLFRRMVHTVGHE